MFNLLKKFSFAKIIFFVSFILISNFFANKIFANDFVNIYLFHGDGCPHCAKELEFLRTQVVSQYQGKVNIHTYEVYYDQENSQLFNTLLKKVKPSCQENKINQC